MNLVHPTGFRKGISFLWNSATHTFNADSKQVIPIQAGIKDAIPRAVKIYLKRRGVYPLLANLTKDQFSNSIKVRLLYSPIRHGYGRSKGRYKKLFLQLIRPKSKRSLVTINNDGKLHSFMKRFVDPDFSLAYRKQMPFRWVKSLFRRAYKDREKYRLNLYFTRVLLRGSRRYSWAKPGVLGHSLVQNVLTDIKRRSSGIVRLRFAGRVAMFMRRFKSHAEFKPFQRYRRINWDNKKKWWFKLPHRFWKRRWNHSRHKLGINKYMLAHLFSSSLGKPVKIKLENIFGYAAKKNLLSWATHQKFMWGQDYKKFRYKFPEYMDIVGAVFLMCAFPRETNVLAQHFLWLMYKSLRSSYKLKKFFRFINILVTNYHLLRRNFKVFNLVLAGKIGGGTKRTKLLKFGYGRLVLQSVHKNLTRNFMPFDHKWGAFGIKLFMVRRERLNPKITQRMLFDD